MLGFLLYFLWFVTVAWPVEEALKRGARRTAIVAGVVTISLPLLAWWALPYIHLFGMLVVLPVVQFMVAAAFIRHVRRAPSHDSAERN
jgi:hypothetical protein